MAETAVDVVVLGMGPGGEDVAGKLAEAGLDVVGIEKELLGGECPYWGCIPTKMMVRGSNLLAEGRRVNGFAGQASVRPDWAPVAQRIRKEATDDWNDQVAVDRFTGKGGRFVRGTGRLAGEGLVDVDGERFRARRGIVIATGAVPVVPPVPGLQDVDFWTNRDAVKADPLPESLVILGGGAIGLELAQAFARFGTRVSVVEGSDRPLPMEEPEASALIKEVFEREGIDLHLGHRAQRVVKAGGRFEVELEGGGKVSGDRLLVATGRRPNTKDLGLETAGIEAERGVPVDGRLQAAPGLWAIGDVTGLGFFTHLSVHHAGLVAEHILGKQPPDADHHAVPRVTFTDPEVGAVGLSEGQARERGLRVRTALSSVPSSTRGWIHGPGNDGLVKLVADEAAGTLVGATSAGPVGGEVLAMLTLAVQARIPIETLKRMIYAYPTFHRAVLPAVEQLPAS
ncbi:MAG TPA: NAD(P)/FAD-dependent oxidoreductase [Candidatus Dormibacteraeota bacterium]